MKDIKKTIMCVLIMGVLVLPAAMVSASDDYLADDVPLDTMADPPVMVPVTVMGTQDYTIASDLFDLINEYRVESGLEPLVLCSDYTDYAETRSRELVIRGGHTRPNGQFYMFDFMDADWPPIEQSGITNIGTAQHLLDMIKNDYAHDKDLKDPDHKAVSIAVFRSAYNGYTYMDFQQVDDDSFTPCDKKYGESPVTVTVDTPADQIRPTIDEFTISTYPDTYELFIESRNMEVGKVLYRVDNSLFDFRSSDESKFTVDEDGRITSVSEGSATLIYTLRASGTEYTKGLYISGVPIGGAYSDVELSLEQETYEYTGSEITPSVRVTRGDHVLEEGVDYTLAYTGNVEAGTGIVKVTGIGMCSGSKKLAFTIVPRDISGGALAGLDEGWTYTGLPIEPPVTVTCGGSMLSEGRDYTVTYASNVDAGEAAVTVTGCGSCTGTITGTFTIESVSLDGAAISFSDEVFWKSGEPLTPALDISLSGKELREGRDYEAVYRDNVEAGTAHVTVNGIGNYKGTAVASFTISALDIAEEAEIRDFTRVHPYLGGAVEPTFSLVGSDGALVEGKDYTVAFRNNKKPGEASLNISGTCRYAGTITETFTIRAVDISEAAVDGLLERYGYTGSPVVPSLIVSFAGHALSEGRDYSVTVTDNTDVGTARVTVRGMGYVTGSRELSFEIVDYPAPAAPLGLVAENVPEGIRLIWNKMDGATSYRVYRERESGGLTCILETEKGEAVATDRQAEAEGFYIYRVTAVTAYPDMEKESGLSAEASMLRASGTEISSIRNKADGALVSWEPVPNADGYTVYRDGSLAALIREPETVSWKDTDAVDGKRHLYQVAAYHSYQGSVYDAACSGMKANVFVARPTVSALKNYSGGTKVTWGKVPDASGYIIYRNGKKVRTIQNGSAVTWKDSAADKNKATYTYKVKAYIKVGSETFKSAASSGKESCFVAMPGIKTLENYSGGTKVTWKKVSGASGYIIYRNGKKVRTIKSGSVLTWKDGAADKNKARYVYQVQAYRKVGGKTYRSEVSIDRTSYFVKKTSIVSAERSGKGVRVKWKKVSGASGYIIYRDGKKVKTIKSGEKLAWKDSAASVHGRKYSYRVVAYRKVGGKSYRAAVSARKSIVR